MDEPYNKIKLGDLVSACGNIGVVTDPDGNTSGNFRVTYRFPVLFPGRLRPRWYAGGECTEDITEAEHKQYFKDKLRYG